MHGSRGRDFGSRLCSSKHGDTHSFASGVIHPLSGIDHTSVMALVGLWGALVGGRAIWAWPATFIVAMLAASLLRVGAATRLCRACDRDVDRPVRIVRCASDPTAHRARRRGRRSVRVFHGHAHGTEAAARIWPLRCGLYALYGLPSRGGYRHRPVHTAFPRKDRG